MRRRAASPSCGCACRRARTRSLAISWIARAVARAISSEPSVEPESTISSSTSRSTRWRAHRAQHLVEVAGAVQHGDRDGDDAHVPRRRRRIAAARPSSIPAGSCLKRFMYRSGTPSFHQRERSMADARRRQYSRSASTAFRRCSSAHSRLRSATTSSSASSARRARSSGRWPARSQLLGDPRRLAVEDPEAEHAARRATIAAGISRRTRPADRVARRVGALGSMSAWRTCWRIAASGLQHACSVLERSGARRRLDRVEDRRARRRAPAATTSQIGSHVAEAHEERRQQHRRCRSRSTSEQQRSAGSSSQVQRGATPATSDEDEHRDQVERRG